MCSYKTQMKDNSCLFSSSTFCAKLRFMASFVLVLPRKTASTWGQYVWNKSKRSESMQCSSSKTIIVVLINNRDRKGKKQNIRKKKLDCSNNIIFSYGILILRLSLFSFPSLTPSSFHSLVICSWISQLLHETAKWKWR